jgi:hypothetical protein
MLLALFDGQNIGKVTHPAIIEWFIDNGGEEA